MEFEEMKMIWDSQEQEPLYAMNEAALHRVVQRRLEGWRQTMSRCFAIEITVGLVCGAAMLACAGVLALGDPAWLTAHTWVKVSVSRWHVLAVLAAAGIWFYYGAFMTLARKRQQRRVEDFDSSLRGDIDRALAQTDFQVAVARSIVWWGMIPVWIAAFLWIIVLFQLQAAPAWAYAISGALASCAFVIEVARKHRSIENRYQPRRRELEALRAKLADPQR